jgi:hypothetical protein
MAGPPLVRGQLFKQCHSEMTQVYCWCLGLYHLGVVKTLNEQGLLPRVICGSSVGALIASLVCVHTDEELPVSG